MARRIFAVSLCAAALALAGCSTVPQSGAGSGESGAERVDAEFDAPARDLEYPEQTRMVWRVRPERAARGLQSKAAESDEGGENEAGEASPATRVVHRVATAMIRGDFHPERMFVGLAAAGAGEATDRDELPLTAVDVERPVVVAAATSLDGRTLKALRFGTPPVEQADLPRGFHFRIFFPAAEGEAAALRDQIKEMCDAGSCPHLVGTGARDSRVVVDLVLGPGADEVESISSTAETERPGLFDRLTPAARAFLTSDRAWSFYAPSDSMTPINGLTGAIEAYTALENASPEKRARLMIRGYDFAGRVFEWSDSAAREREGFATSFGLGPEGSWTIRAVATSTERGAAISRATRRERELPAIDVDSADVEFETALDPEGIEEEAVVPRPLEEAVATGDWTSVAQHLRSTGRMTYYEILLNHPMGTLKAIQSSWAELPGLASIADEPPTEISALRAAFAFDEEGSNSGGSASRGAVALSVGPDSEFPDRIRSVAPKLRQQIEIPLDVKVRSREDSGEQVVTVTLGDLEEPFGSPRAVESRFLGTIRPSGLPDAAEIFGRRVVRRTPALQQVAKVLRRGGPVHVALDHDSEGRAARLQIGSEQPERFEVADSAASPIQPEGIPECLRRAGDASRSRLRAVGEEPYRVREIVSDLFEELNELEETCSESSESTASGFSWIRGRWLTYRAAFELRTGYFGEALESVRRVCALDARDACAAERAVESIRENYRAPRAAPHRHLYLAPSEMRYLGREAPFYPELPDPIVRRSDGDGPETRALVEATESGESGSIEKFVSELQTETIETADGSRASVVVLPVDRRLPAGLIQAFVEAAGDRQIAERVRQQAKIMGEEVPPKTITGVALHAGPGRAREPGIPVVLLRTSSSTEDDRASPVRLEVGSDGLSIRSSDGARLEPVEECDESGPTLCVRDAARAAELTEKLAGRDGAPDREPELSEQLAELYRLDRVAEVLGREPVDPAEASFELALPADYPLSVVARLAAAIGEVARKESEDDSVPHITVTTTDSGP